MRSSITLENAPNSFKNMKAKYTEEAKRNFRLIWDVMASLFQHCMLYVGLLLCLTLMLACHAPKASKCASDKPGFILVQDNFTGECVEINTALVRVILDQGSYTYIMTVDAQGIRYHYKIVESYAVVKRKMDRAYERINTKF